MIKINNMNFNKFTFGDWVIFFLDVTLFSIIVICFFTDVVLIFTFFLNKLNNILLLDNLINFINVTQGNSSTTNTTILHSNEGWAQGIKSIFIYGTGVIRLQLLRSGGTPLSRGFVIGSTIVADAASTALKNAINDPEYVEKHFNSWKRISTSASESNSGSVGEVVEFNVDNDSETLTTLKEIKEATSNLTSNDLTNLSENLFNEILNYFKSILQPVPVDYSMELLANQIHGISIILFVLSILMIILLIAFMFNILIFVYSDKLLNLFTNKYIR